MKKQVMIAVFLLSLVFLAGCGYTSKATADVCDDTCQQERDDYIQQVNALLKQAEVITAKVDEWKTVTKEDLGMIISLKNQVFTLNVPKDFDMAQDYYQRAFTHFVEAIDFVVNANEAHGLASDTTNIQTHNMMTSQVVYNIQESNKLLIYADEEIKFAMRLVSKN